MARFAISPRDSALSFGAVRYGLPPLPPAQLICALPASLLSADKVESAESAESADEASGPGWYQSSRELRRGLEVRDAPFDDWLVASSFGGIPFAAVAS